MIFQTRLAPLTSSPAATAAASRSVGSATGRTTAGTHRTRGTARVNSNKTQFCFAYINSICFEQNTPATPRASSPAAMATASPPGGGATGM